MAHRRFSAAAVLPPARAHFLDALRAVATLLVLVLHAAVPYLVRPMPRLLWATCDPVPSPIVDGLFWWVECFVMPLFFLIAGFAAAESCRARGGRAFLAQRTRRLLVPLLAGGAVILPVTFYIWAVGWVLDGRYPWHKLRTLAFDDDERLDLYGLSHLWFLEYLYIYCLLFAVACWLRRTIGLVNWRPPLTVWPVLLAAPCALILWYDPRVVLGFYQTFLPVPSKLLYYALFFTAGVATQRIEREPVKLGDRGFVFFGMSLVAFACALPLIQQHLVHELTGSLRVLLAIFVALVASLSTLGLFGLFVRLLDRPKSVLGYVAEASFWVYMTHLPLVACIHVGLARTGWPASLKFVLAVLGTAAITLLSYRLLVRETRLGAWLSGRRAFLGDRTRGPMESKVRAAA